MFTHAGVLECWGVGAICPGVRLHKLARREGDDPVASRDDCISRCRIDFAMHISGSPSNQMWIAITDVDSTQCCAAFACLLEVHIILF